jgi:DNA-binding CsgD family transcriptional regulator
MLQRLSDLENQILWEIAKGATDREVALELLLNESAVKKYVRAIIKKLGVRSRAEAIALALRERTN